jgi:hypothetical protein
MPVDGPNDEEAWVDIDCREAIASPPAVWDAERRALYLLRLDVPRPLSVDVLVWPRAEPTDGSRVAMTVIGRVEARSVRPTWLTGPIKGRTQLLGYDVADHHFTSGLSGCSYTEEETRTLRPTWGRHLNRFHLFEQVDVAAQFKTLTDLRVREHAPFIVFGIYLLE